MARLLECGAVYYATVVGGLGHDQGTRPWLALSRGDVMQRTREIIAMPLSHVEPPWGYPFTWRVPDGLLPQASWVLISRPRGLLAARLRGPVARLDRGQLAEIVDGLRQLITD
jgi:hypothetical protein